MRMNNRYWIQGLAGALLWTGAGLAQAQLNPELGVSGEAEGEGEADLSEDTSSSSSSWSDDSSSTSSVSDDSSDNASLGSGSSDHDTVVGRLGVGFFGTVGVPALTCDNAPGDCTPELETLTAPTIGARYWLSAGLGAEIAVGFNMTSPSQESEIDAGGMTTRVVNTEDPSVFAFAVHGGVPLVFAHSGHFVFEAVPQVNLGFASGSHDIVGGGMVREWDVSGFLLEAGAKLGAEIHFGFIDVPQLSLQATLGVALRIESRGVEGENSAGGTTSHSADETRFSTGVDGAPWEIFTGGLTAIYYL